jgi:hypothetical protein
MPGYHTERLAAERQSRIVFRTVGATLPILSFNRRDSRFHEFLDERDGQWLVRGEVVDLENVSSIVQL